MSKICEQGGGWNKCLWSRRLIKGLIFACVCWSHIVTEVTIQPLYSLSKCVSEILCSHCWGGGGGSVIQNQLSRRQFGSLCCSFPGGFRAGFYFTNEAEICRRLRVATHPISTQQLLKLSGLQLPNFPHVDRKSSFLEKGNAAAL